MEYIIYHRPTNIGRRAADANEWEAARVEGSLEEAKAKADTLQADADARGQALSFKVYRLGKRGRAVGDCLHWTLIK